MNVYCTSRIGDRSVMITILDVTGSYVINDNYGDMSLLSMLGSVQCVLGRSTSRLDMGQICI